jgi:hypothetical protein
VSDTHLTYQTLHVTLMEHIAYQTIILAQEESPLIAGYNAGGVLAAMLQDGQGIIERLIDVRFAHYANNATHA